jgi:hypothetical protein
MDNVVIWPEFVDACLELVSVQYVLIEEADEARAAYAFLTLAQSGALDVDKIIWADTTAPEQARRSCVSFEDGRWVQRDGQYRIYDIHQTALDCTG